jgi:hypothetical protein
VRGRIAPNLISERHRHRSVSCQSSLRHRPEAEAPLFNDRNEVDPLSDFLRFVGERRSGSPDVFSVEVLILLRQLEQDLWVIDHPFSMFGGIQIGTRTTLVRLSNGDLFAHGLGPIEEDDHAEIAALGKVTQLVAPNLFHNAYVADWVARYPEATCYAPARFGTKVKDLDFIPLSDQAAPAWSGDLEQVAVEGAPQLDEVVFFHPATRTLLLTDLCFNMLHSDSFLTRLFMRMMGGYGHFGPSRLARSLMKDKVATRRGIERILEWDFDRVTVTHGEVLESGGSVKFRQAYTWLLE